MKRVVQLFYENCVIKRLLLSAFVAVFAINNSFAQGNLVSGTITSAEDGTSLPGVNVVLKGTSIGTVTDTNGNYSLELKDENAILIFSFIGFVSQEIVVSNQKIINIKLNPDVTALSEVVVVGYGTQERKDVSGAISSVTAAQIEKIPVTTLDQALQGRSAGVQVTSNDGSPGSGITVQIRGIGSFGDTGPLYVVDGYPIAGSLNTLNPNDIASMEILKDASATAIYGSRAANGVVIITTKRGKKDGVQVSFDAFGSVQTMPKMYKVLSAQQFAPFAKEVISQTDPGYQGLPEWNDPSTLRNIDWQKEMYQTGGKQNYNLALRGGSEKVQTAFSLGYFKQKGIVKFSDFVRYNATLNLDYTPNKWLKTSVSVKYSRNEGAVRFASGQGGVGNLTKLIPTMTGNPLTDQVKDANGNYGYYTKGASAVSASSNVFADAEQQDQKNETNNLLASAFIELSLAKGLKAKSNFGINTTDGSGYYFTPSSQRNSPPARANFNQNSKNTFEWLWENTLMYSRTFGDHNIDFVGGVSAQKNTFRQLYVAINDQVSDGTRSVAGFSTKITNFYGNTTIWSLASQFARLTYKFKDRYILTGTVRRDGSSRFRPGIQYGVFPSVAAAWKVKEEPFMSGINFISDLKVRGSWGQTGNQNIIPFQYLSLYSAAATATRNNGYVFGSSKTLATGIAPIILTDRDLKWESTTQSDVGIDVAVLNGKVSFTADYYRRVSSNFLFDLPTPSQTGFTHAASNFGSIENKGLELSLGYRESEADLQWGISANITTVNNKILSLSQNVQAISNLSNQGFPTYGGTNWTVFSQSKVGGEVGAFYGFKTAGIFQTKQEVKDLTTLNNKDSVFYQTSTTTAGDRKFVDVNGDGKVTDADRVILGSPIPKFYGGVNVDATYKNFDLSMFWYVSYGNKILNYAKRNLESFATNGGVGIQNVSESFYLNRWTEANHSTTTPRAVRSDVSGNTRVSDAYVEDGSYMRLRNVQLGYTLPVSLFNKIKISKMRIYVSAQNLFTITKYSGLDPEIGQATDNTVGPGTSNPNVPQRNVTASGIDMGNFPTSRSYTLGLNLQF